MRACWAATLDLKLATLCYLVCCRCRRLAFCLYSSWTPAGIAMRALGTYWGIMLVVPWQVWVLCHMKWQLSAVTSLPQRFLWRKGTLESDSFQTLLIWAKEAAVSLRVLSRRRFALKTFIDKGRRLPIKHLLSWAPPVFGKSAHQGGERFGERTD